MKRKCAVKTAGSLLLAGALANKREPASNGTWAAVIWNAIMEVLQRILVS